MFVGCNHDEKETIYKEIGIEKTYPYLLEKKSIENANADTFDLFDHKIHLVNSIGQLKNDRLFTYATGYLQEELSKCNFDKYTLVITSSSSLYEISDIEYNFSYDKYNSEYRYYQMIHSKQSEDTARNLYYVINAFLIMKIPDNSRTIFIRSLL